MRNICLAKGVLSIFFICRLGPSIYCSPQKCQESQAHQKLFENVHPLQLSKLCSSNLIKDPKMH